VEKPERTPGRIKVSVEVSALISNLFLKTRFQPSPEKFHNTSPNINVNNRKFKTMGLILRSSDIHAVGCYATAPIPAKTKVVEYTGERISPEEGDNRYEHREVTYLFGMEDGKTVIDGHGMAAFINHSCDPNCETDEIDGRVWIISIRDIAPGEEITYDYNLYDGEEDDPAPCSCGAGCCRGSMFSPEEIERLKNLQEKVGQSA